MYAESIPSQAVKRLLYIPFAEYAVAINVLITPLNQRNL